MRTKAICHGSSFVFSRALRLYGAPMGYTITADSNEAGRTAERTASALDKGHCSVDESIVRQYTKIMHQAIPNNIILVYQYII